MKKNNNMTRDCQTAPGFMVFLSSSISEKVIYILSLLLLLAMMGIIFRFSSANGVDSSGHSQRIARMLFNLLQKICPAMMVREDFLAFVAIIETPIRKLAHFSEYSMLGFLMQFHIRSVRKIYVWQISSRKAYLYGIIFSVLYACSDEIHQYFVPERACRFLDVGIDSIGVLFGCFLFYVIFFRLLDGHLRKGYNENSMKNNRNHG